MYTLWNCPGFWKLVTPEAICRLTLFKRWGIGFSLVGASTWVLGLLELAAYSLYEELTVLHRP